jgi:excisionase family DNA binding protein
MNGNNDVVNGHNDVVTMDDNAVATMLESMRKGSRWLTAFLESYRPPLDGERYLTDREVAELLRVSRRTLQEYRNDRLLPYILLGGKVLYPESGLREVLEANYRKPLR